MKIFTAVSAGALALLLTGVVTSYLFEVMTYKNDVAFGISVLALIAVIFLDLLVFRHLFSWVWKGVTNKETKGE